jgi:hypothetical protein
MQIQVITPVEALRRTRASLGLNEFTADIRPFIAATLRRAAGIMCPCRPWELSRAVWTSLQPLGGGVTEALVQDVLDEVLMIGDLAEVAFSNDDGSNDRLRLCLVPLAFVRRPQGHLTLLGGRPDEVSALPSHITQRIHCLGVARHIVPTPGEDLPKLLTEFGLLEIDPQAWLRLPRLETALAHITALRRSMPSLAARDVERLMVLGPGSSYSRRWCEPTDLTGLYVARRPQTYGAPVWSAIELSHGKVTSLFDLHAPGSRWRPCDVAWHLQAALDAIAGSPQAFERTDDTANGHALFEFFSPLPSWAERRLRLAGERVETSRALLGFSVPVRAASEESRFLQDHLWMHEKRG